MECLKVYRAVKDINPSLITDFYVNNPKSGVVLGRGMYFAFNAEYAINYLKNFNQVGILGYYQLSGNLKILDNSEHGTSKAHKLLEQFTKAEQLFKSISFELQGEFRNLPDEAHSFWSDEEISNYLKESFRLMDEKRNSHPRQPELLAEMKRILDLQFAIKEQLNLERQNFDISIEDYNEVCVHSSNVKIDLLSYDLHFSSEKKAKYIYDQLKSGELRNNKIINLDPNTLNLASRLCDEPID